jgi:hypothetical protein
VLFIRIPAACLRLLANAGQLGYGAIGGVATIDPIEMNFNSYGDAQHMGIQEFLDQYDRNYANAKRGVEKNSIWLFLSGIAAYSMGAGVEGRYAQAIVVSIFIFQVAALFSEITKENHQIRALSVLNKKIFSKHRRSKYPWLKKYWHLKIYFICTFYIFWLYSFGDNGCIGYIAKFFGYWRG